MLSVEEKKRLEELDDYGIEELFTSQCESWFTADVACCELCVDDYLKSWPFSEGTEDFQNNAMDIEHFYASTILRDCYSLEDYKQLMQLVECPRCDEALTGYFYPYSFPFQPVDFFEDILHELSALAHKSPFVMLKHYFASQILEAIGELSEQAIATSIVGNLFRARVASQIEDPKADDFDITPKQYASEGRYNHAGLPAFYLGSDQQTCYEEMRQENCYIAEIKINKQVKILDLSATYDNHKKHSDMLDTMVHSALVSAKHNDEGQYKPQYIFSRFVADCAKYSGFDAIKYPSTRTVHGCFNIVFLNADFGLGKGCELVEIHNYPPKK
jgi:hypothetical protein